MLKHRVVAKTALIATSLSLLITLGVEHYILTHSMPVLPVLDQGAGGNYDAVMPVLDRIVLERQVLDSLSYFSSIFIAFFLMWYLGNATNRLLIGALSLSLTSFIDITLANHTKDSAVNVAMAFLIVLSAHLFLGGKDDTGLESKK